MRDIKKVAFGIFGAVLVFVLMLIIVNWYNFEYVKFGLYVLAAGVAIVIFVMIYMFYNGGRYDRKN